MKGISRRSLLTAAANAALLGIIPGAALAVTKVAQSGDPLMTGLRDSGLVYLTPLKSNGDDSRCQAEVWFVYDEVDVYVVSDTTAWRSRAIQQGLVKSRIWVGDLGQWQRTDGKYRQLPQLSAEGSVVTDSNTRKTILERFGEKYRGEWLIWGPRFHRGLEDGSRVMLRYRPLTV